MSSATGALRQARSEVIPQVPELAPYLPSDPNIIRTALLGVVATKGIDPATIPEKDINKATRHTMVGFMMREVRCAIVEGEGDEARFTVPVTANARGNKNRRAASFADGMATIQHIGASRVTNRYTGGRDMAHSWYPGFTRRYHELGQEAEQITPHRQAPRFRLKPYITNPIPNEGNYLYDAMRSQGLSSGVNYYAKIIRAKVDDYEARAQAAHDMTNVPLLSLAGTHFYEFTAPRSNPGKIKGSVSISGHTGKHTLQMGAGDRDVLFPSVADLPNATLKCPVHAALTPEQAEEQGSRDTNLVFLAHAAINLAHEQFDLFR